MIFFSMTEQETTIPTLDEAVNVVTVADIAARLHVNRITVRRWIKAGTLPATKVGKEYRVHVADVIKLVTPGAPKG